MTRKEAVKKLQLVVWPNTEDGFINKLEALGLIKFDQELTAKQIIESMQGQVSGDYVISELQRGGYKIIKE